MSAEEVPGNAPFLSLRGISKSYPGVHAVVDVDLDLHSHEIVGLVGKNGAGKSTLIKLLAGLTRPDEGAIVCDGKDVHLARPADSSALGLAFVHQELSLVPNLSVAENVLLGLGFPTRGRAFVQWGTLRDRAVEVLARLEADIDPRALAGTLSVAEQRLVMLARGLAADARLVVLDEPTASLTDAEITHLFRVVRALRDAGVCILFVSHRLNEVMGFTDRIVVMRDGSVVSRLNTGALDHEDLVRAITGVQTGHSLDVTREPAVTKDADAVADSRREVLRVEHVELLPRLHDVSLSAYGGEVLGIAGLVGAGRTELCRVIFGVDRARSGTVLVHGKRVKPGRLRHALQHGIVLLPEDRREQGNVLDFSIKRNITLATLAQHRRLKGLPWPSRKAEGSTAATMISRLDISTSGADQIVRSLSGGNQQKVVLGKWLKHGAEVFIFDEPTHGVDIGGKREIYTIMRELADTGKVVIFISSEFSELVGLCDRILVLSQGRVVSELSGNTSETEILRHCYLAG
jgi:ABC-type sugar transport system ATPase subunit